MEKNIVTILPNAASLIESMRSIGYSFETAIADIIDNSISAQAKNIKIYQRESNDVPYIQIIDDGLGMTDEELIEAMRLGSKNPNDQRESSDLGRFGLGLKSASFSQCRTLTVISKKNHALRGYKWDLDLVQRTDRFSVIRLSDHELDQIPNISELSDNESGTIVQWEDFDRITDATHNLSKELGDLVHKAIEHISLIFHLFILDGLSITVNFIPVEPKDPFLTKHSATQELENKKVRIDDKLIYLQPFVIPHYSKLSAEDKRKSGKTNEQFKAQGFYLYRNKRLIVWGDYLGLAKKSELGKNVRIRVDIPNDLDYLWEIDVKKSRASVPSRIKKNLLSVINDGENISKKVNTHRGTKEINIDKPIWNFYSDRDNEFYLEVNQTNQLYLDFVSTLDDKQVALFNVFAKALESNIPVQAIYSQISDGNTNTLNDENLLLDELRENLTTLKEANNININMLLKSMLSEEPYASNKLVTEFINEEMKNNGEF